MKCDNGRLCAMKLHAVMTRIPTQEGFEPRSCDPKWGALKLLGWQALQGYPDILFVSLQKIFCGYSLPEPRIYFCKQIRTRIVSI